MNDSAKPEERRGGRRLTGGRGVNRGTSAGVTDRIDDLRRIMTFNPAFQSAAPQSISRKSGNGSIRTDSWVFGLRLQASGGGKGAGERRSREISAVTEGYEAAETFGCEVLLLRLEKLQPEALIRSRDRATKFTTKPGKG